MSRSAVVHLCFLPLDLCRCEVTTMRELREVGTLSLSDGFGEFASGADVCFCERRRGVVVWR